MDSLLTRLFSMLFGVGSCSRVYNTKVEHAHSEAVTVEFHAIVRICTRINYYYQFNIRGYIYPLYKSISLMHRQMATHNKSILSQNTTNN